MTVCLAELSNDTFGQLKPEVIFDVNYQGSVNSANGLDRHLELSKKGDAPSGH